MTRLLYLPDDATIMQYELNIPPKQLAAAVNSGLQPIPLLSDIPQKLSARLIGNTVIVFPFQLRENRKRRSVYSNLTHRQSQVLELAMHGYSTTQIASLIGLSARTVNYHMNKIKALIKPGIYQALCKTTPK
jgi:DNA-binding CsgD family transcriptional regulator